MTDLLGPATASNSVTARPADPRVFGTLDTWFKNCTSALADDGTEIDAEFLNLVLAELRGVWRANGATVAGPAVLPENNVDAGLALAINHLIQRQRQTYAAASGSANALVITLTPTPAELIPGQRVSILTGSSPNTGPATLQISAVGGGAGAVIGISGRDLAGLQKGDLPANAICTLEFDGSRWQLLEARPSGLVHYGVDVSASVNAVTVAVADFTPPAPLPWYDGMILAVKIAHTNTSGTVAFEAVTVARSGGVVLAPGDIVAGSIALFLYHDAYFELLNPAVTSAFYYGVDGGSTNNVYPTTWFGPQPSGYSYGQTFAIRMAATNTGASVFSPLYPMPILRPNGTPLLPGDMALGRIALMTLHDGFMELLNPRATDWVTIDVSIAAGTAYTLIDVSGYDVVHCAAYLLVPNSYGAQWAAAVWPLMPGEALPYGGGGGMMSPFQNPAAGAALGGNALGFGGGLNTGCSYAFTMQRFPAGLGAVSGLSQNGVAAADPTWSVMQDTNASSTGAQCFPVFADRLLFGPELNGLDSTRTMIAGAIRLVAHRMNPAF